MALYGISYCAGWKFSTSMNHNHYIVICIFPKQEVFTIPCLVCSPHPQPEVLMGKQSTCWHFWNRWFWHTSPAGQVLSHSICSIRFKHSDPGPHGLSAVDLHSQWAISEGSIIVLAAVMYRLHCKRRDLLGLLYFTFLLCMCSRLSQERRP